MSQSQSLAAARYDCWLRKYRTLVHRRTTNYDLWMRHACGGFPAHSPHSAAFPEASRFSTLTKCQPANYVIHEKARTWTNRKYLGVNSRLAREYLRWSEEDYRHVKYLKISEDDLSSRMDMKPSYNKKNKRENNFFTHHIDEEDEGSTSPYDAIETDFKNL